MKGYQLSFPPRRNIERYVTEKGNKVEVTPCEIKRVIPLEEVRDSEYEDMADLAVIFNHDIVETPQPADPRRGRTWRWKENSFINWLYEYSGVYIPASVENHADGEQGYGSHCTETRASLNLDTLIYDLYNGMFSMEEWMKFYMQMGYSLCGYAEVFGQHEANEFHLPGVKKPTETIIEYMRRVHRGQILKL